MRCWKYQNLCTVLTNRAVGRHARANEVHPELNLCQLLLCRVRKAEDNDVDTVGVSDEVIVSYVVRLES